MPLIKKKAVKTAKAKEKPPVKKTRTVQAGKPKAVEAIPQVTIEQRVEETKYYAGPVIQKFAEERPFEFPAGYGDNRIVLMVRDPFWIYAYWETKDQRQEKILRVYDTENWQSFDIELTGGARSWYIRVPAPNRTYCVDIGYYGSDGKFIALIRSNWVTTPLDRMSDIIDEQWMIPDWEKMYALSGGFGIGRGSMEIQELIKKRFQEESASGWVTSMGSPVKKIGERPFWLVANCELIVYGATEPTATVTVQGRKIPMREDGTFSLRFSLPDGKQVIPIEAIRDDGAQRRKITPIVERKTE